MLNSCGEHTIDQGWQLGAGLNMMYFYVADVNHFVISLDCGVHYEIFCVTYCSGRV